MPRVREYSIHVGKISDSSAAALPPGFANTFTSRFSAGNTLLPSVCWEAFFRLDEEVVLPVLDHWLPPGLIAVG